MNYNIFTKEHVVTDLEFDPTNDKTKFRIDGALYITEPVDSRHDTYRVSFQCVKGQINENLFSFSKSSAMYKYYWDKVKSADTESQIPYAYIVFCFMLNYLREGSLYRYFLKNILTLVKDLPTQVYTYDDILPIAQEETEKLLLLYPWIYLDNSMKFLFEAAIVHTVLSLIKNRADQETLYEDMSLILALIQSEEIYRVISDPDENLFTTIRLLKNETLAWIDHPESIEKEMLYWESTKPGSNVRWKIPLTIRLYYTEFYYKMILFLERLNLAQEKDWKEDPNIDGSLLGRAYGKSYSLNSSRIMTLIKEVREEEKKLSADKIMQKIKSSSNSEYIIGDIQGLLLFHL